MLAHVRSSQGYIERSVTGRLFRHHIFKALHREPTTRALSNMTTSIQKNLVKRNERYHSMFKHGDLPIPPAKKYAVGESLHFIKCQGGFRMWESKEHVH